MSTTARYCRAARVAAMSVGAYVAADLLVRTAVLLHYADRSHALSKLLYLSSFTVP